MVVANRFEYLEVSRFDEVLRKIFDFKSMAGHKVYQRYFKKFPYNVEVTSVLFLSLSPNSSSDMSEEYKARVGSML